MPRLLWTPKSLMQAPGCVVSRVAGNGVQRAAETSHASYDENEISQLGVVYRLRAGATVAANVPSGPPDSLRKEVCQRLDQVCHSPFRTATRHHASLVRIAEHHYS